MAHDLTEAEVEAAARALGDAYDCPVGTDSWDVFEGQLRGAARDMLTAAAGVRSDALAAITERAERAERELAKAHGTDFNPTNTWLRMCRNLEAAEATIRQARDILGRGQPDRQPERKEAHRVLCLAVAAIDGAKP